MKHLSKEDNFNELISKGTYLVDFYADWCGPCKMIAPILESLEGIDVIKVNVDEFQELSGSYGVMSIPTLIFFKDGEEIKKEIGFRSKEELEDIIKTL